MSPLKKATFLLALLLLGSGQKCSTVPATNPATVVVSAPKAEELTVVSNTVVPEAVAAHNEAEQARLSKIAANMKAAKTVQPAIPETNPTKAVFTEIDLTQNQLEDVVINPKDFEASMNRVTLQLQGQIVEAEKAKLAAMTEAARMRAEIAEAKKREDDAIALSKRISEETKAELVKAAADSAKRFNELENAVKSARTDAANAIDQARKESNTRLSWAILGISSLFFIGGGALLILTQGKEIMRGGLALAIGSIGYGVYWAINQSWFKYACWAAIAAVTGVIIYGLVYEYRRRKKLDTDMKDYDQVWETGKKVVSAIDKWKSEVGENVAKPLLEKLKGETDESHRGIVHELRFENETGKTPSPPSA